MFYVGAGMPGTEMTNTYSPGEISMFLLKTLPAMLLILSMSTSARSQPASLFYPGGTYDERIFPPDSSLGFPLGQRPA